VVVEPLLKAGRAAIAGGGGCTDNTRARVVLPTPLFVLAKVSVLVNTPEGKAVAAELIAMVTDVAAPAASVPLVGESVAQLALVVAVQPSGETPLFETISEKVVGENGPPIGPVLARVVDETVNTGGPVMVNFAERELFPSPVVVLLNVMVSVLVDAVKVFAVPLIEAVQSIVAPGASVPDVRDSVSHEAVFAAVQLRVKFPVLVRL
jgi:hypothetical protein